MPPLGPEDPRGSDQSEKHFQPQNKLLNLVRDHIRSMLWPLTLGEQNVNPPAFDVNSSHDPDSDTEASTELIFGDSSDVGESESQPYVQSGLLKKLMLKIPCTKMTKQHLLVG